jgi:hypothetical protein
MAPPTLLALQTVRWLFAAASFLLFVGCFTPIASVLVSALLIISRLWVFSLGKIDHDILFVITPACLAFSRWGEALSVDAWRRRMADDAGSQPMVTSDRDAWPFGFLALLIAFGYVVAGAQKIIGGWLDISTSATIGWVVYFGTSIGRSTFGYRYIDELVRLPQFLQESFDWLTVAFDFAFAAGLANRRLFQSVCLVAVLFHLGTMLLFGIYFPSYPPVYAAFVPWGLLLEHVAGRARSQKLIGALANPLGLVLLAGIIFALRNSITPNRLMLVFTFGAVIGLAWIAWTVIRRAGNAASLARRQYQVQGSPEKLSSG